MIHDDGTVETGYQSGPGILGIFADKFTPSKLSKHLYVGVPGVQRGCVEATTSERVEVVVFDDDGPGGSPAPSWAQCRSQLTNIPIFPDPTPVWNSFDISSLNIVVNDGERCTIGAALDATELVRPGVPGV